MKKLFIILLLLASCIQSCSIQKRSTKKKIQTEEFKDVTTSMLRTIKEKRAGEQITTPIIPVEKRERDENGDFKEFIKEFKKGGLTKTVYYKPDGSVDVQCIEDAIDRLITEKIKQQDNTVTNTETKEKNKEKEESFQSEIILYIVIGLVCFVILAMVIFFRVINKKISAIS